MKIGKILIADDHELILEGISKMLSETFDIGEISTFTDPRDVLSEIHANCYDLYILDLDLGFISGADIVKAIHAVNHDARIIIITMHEEIWNVNMLQELDVDGIILKRSSGEYLEYAVRSVMTGKSFMCPGFTRLKNLNTAYKKRLKNKNSLLTSSEKNVLKHIADGRTSKEIAAFTGVTEDAIEAHRKNLFLKLEARNAAQLVSIALRKNLLD